MEWAHRGAKVKRSTGISGTSAAFIDVSFVLIMVLLFCVAALKTHEPERVKIDASIATQGQASDEKPLASLKIYDDGVVINDDEHVVPHAELARVMTQLAGQDGAIGICVAEGVSYQLVRNTIAAVQSVAGQRQWTDCGGGL